MTVIDVEIDTGSVKALPVSITVTDKTLLTGTAKLCGWSLRDASGDTTTQTEAAVISPGAGAAIVTLSGLAAGTYDITWVVALQGAAAAADANNFQLKNGAAVVEGSVNPGAAGVYPQNGARVNVAANGTITVNAIAAGTVGVTYLAQIEVAITLIPNAVAEIQDGGNILGEIAVPAGESTTEWFDRDGIDVQGQIKLHMISGTMTGVIYAKFAGGQYTP